MMNANKIIEKSSFFKLTSEYKNLKKVMITKDEQNDNEAIDEILTNFAVTAHMTTEMMAVM
jgi:hypothetical protein